MKANTRFGTMVFLGCGFFLLETNLLSDGLEGKAGEYIRKLNKFEVERVEKARAEIWEKRVQVAAALKRELVAATKRGDLDGANAIKAEIERLKGKVDLAVVKVPGEEKEGKVESRRDKEKAFMELFVGKMWKAFSYGYKFDRRGTVVRVTLEGDGKGQESGGREWEIVSSDTVAVTSSGPVRYFTFTSATEGTTKTEGQGSSSPISLVE